MNSFRGWIHGLAAAAISAIATALTAVAVLPEFFNLSHDGLIHTSKLIIVPSIVAVAAYLKQSPLPAVTVTATETKTTTVDVTKQ